MLNKTFFEDLIVSNFKTKTEFAKALAIKIPSVNEWIERGVIPQARLLQVLELLKVTNDDERDKLFNVPKVSVCYRASKTAQENAIKPHIKSRAAWVAKIFLAIHDNKPTSDLLNTLRSELQNQTDVKDVVSVIRRNFGLTEITPFVIDQSYFFLQSCGVNRFYLPFKKLGLNDPNGVNPLAFTAHRNNEFFVLCDSERSLDSMNFDSTHELVHILTGNMKEDDADIEKWVDLITEELIYPKALLLKEFPFLISDKPTKIREFNLRKLNNLFNNYLSMSPRGFAKALVSYGFINKDHVVFKWFTEILHKQFARPTGSVYGKMDFDFSDSYELETFYSKIVDTNPSLYPLFTDLRSALTNNQISVKNFSELFFLDSGDVDELRKGWLQTSRASNN
jgi:hypothetical protein